MGKYSFVVSIFLPTELSQNAIHDGAGSKPYCTACEETQIARIDGQRGWGLVKSLLFPQLLDRLDLKRLKYCWAIKLTQKCNMVPKKNFTIYLKRILNVFGGYVYSSFSTLQNVDMLLNTLTNW